MGTESQTYSLPVLPFENMVLFPMVAVPLSIQRPATIKAVEAALASENKMIAVLTRKDAAKENPQPEDFYELGTVATIQLIARFGATEQIIVHGMERIVVVDLIQTHSYLRAQVRPCPVTKTHNIETEALQREVLEHTSQYFALAHPDKMIKFPPLLSTGEDILQLVYPVIKLFQLELDKEQELLAASSDKEVLELFNDHLYHEIQDL